MDPLVFLSPATDVVSVVVLVMTAYLKYFSATWFLLKHYGLAGFWLVVFGSTDILRSELQVLASDGEQAALDFKKAAQDESNMIAITDEDS
jgi:hypothetical protein